ncbi:MAG: hypothetical protein KGD65_06995 [Candidatus Lokiarchaeota archaeon]|nr:hypothetical protein [Candidatus Lokiarchaeota archaeon]
MTTKSTQRNLICILSILGSLQFVLLTTIAMYFYKGGTYIDPTPVGYIFWQNYFSDLGRTVAHSGIPNTISFVLFTVTLSLWGITQIPFYITFPTLFKSYSNLRKVSICGSSLAIISGISYVGIAFTPSDIAGSLHDLFVVIGFSFVFFSIILYSYVIFKTDNYPNFYAIILTISAFILSVYFLFLFFTSNSQTPEGLLIYVVGQKFMIYTLLICNIIQGYGALKQKSS